MSEQEGKREGQKPKITDEMREYLRAPLPPEAIRKHPTKPSLSTIKAIYIVERLNDVFGLGCWTLKTEVVDEADNYVLMRGELILLGYEANIPVQYGGHKTLVEGKKREDGSRLIITDRVDGYKSAVTDCLSKCASYLEIGIDVFKGKIQQQTSSHSSGKVHTEDKPEDKDKEKRMHEQIGYWLMEMAGNDKVVAKELLFEYTSFKGKDGSSVKGLHELKDLKGRRLEVSFDIIKEKYKKRIERGE